MECEKEEGNIEYKRSIVDKDDKRLENLSTQMKFRVNEGNGEAFYYIGVEDDGKFTGISIDEYNKTHENLKKIADKNNFTLKLISSKNTEKDKKIYEFLVREINTNKYTEVKIGVAGNVDSGKSSLLGVLSNGVLDNGRGSARLSVFNHKHEIDSGRTSSIAQHILGFDAWGKIINYKGNSTNNSISWPDIVSKSKKIISFYDLAGHEKYLKTTIFGLTSTMPDYCFILVGANMGVSRMTREHIFLCLSLNIPFSIIVTKTDICKTRKNILDITMAQIKKILKLPSLRKVSYIVKNKEDSITAAKNFKVENIVPIFKISNVTGDNIDILRNFLNLLQPRNVKKEETDTQMNIDSIFSVTGVGTVVGGDLVSGKVYVNDKLYLGPNSNGQFIEAQVKSIHIKRTAVLSASSGTYICLALRKINRKLIRKGQVLLSNKEKCVATNEFEAKINVIRSNSTTIRNGYQPVIHTSNIRQTTQILTIKDCETGNEKMLTTGDSAVVTFKFCYRPEYIVSGNQIIFCEGRIKAVGTIL